MLNLEESYRAMIRSVQYCTVNENPGIIIVPGVKTSTEFAQRSTLHVLINDKRVKREST